MALKVCKCAITIKETGNKKKKNKKKIKLYKINSIRCLALSKSPI